MEKVLPLWIQSMRSLVDRNIILARLFASKGGNVRSTIPEEMGGDGKVYELVKVSGRDSTVILTEGVEVAIGATARVVLKANGEIGAIPGSDGSPIGVADAKKIAPAQRRVIALALGKDKKRKRRLLGR